MHTQLTAQSSDKKTTCIDNARKVKQAKTSPQNLTPQEKRANSEQNWAPDECSDWVSRVIATLPLNSSSNPSPYLLVPTASQFGFQKYPTQT